MEKYSAHGCTPFDLLHFLKLGIFKDIREVFWVQVGENGQKAEEIDSVAQQYGEMLEHQSDRDFPKCRFSEGIRGGKLTASEFTGVLVCMLLVVKSGKGQELLRHRSPFWRQEAIMQDWIMLLETLLQWEAWLKSPTMRKYHLQFAKEKHRYIMYLIRKIARRTKGMGLKKVKFHAITHLCEDIENFGVPMEADTGANEQHHKASKLAAKLTQKKKDQFDIQTAKRLMEVELLMLALEEFRGRPLWQYYEGHNHDDDPEEEAPDPPPPSIGGETFKYKVKFRVAPVRTGPLALREVILGMHTCSAPLRRVNFTR